VQQAVDIRTAKAAGAGAVQDFDAVRMGDGKLIGDRAGPVGRRVVDDEKTEPRMVEDAGRQQRQVLALVIGWRND
jgi:hypothetical protein